MPDSGGVGTHWLDYVKQAAVQAVKAGNPCDYTIGTVISVKPLKIKLSEGDGLELPADFIHLSRNVTDFKTKITMKKQGVYHTTHTPPPTDTWIDEQEITVHNALKKGEKVLMIRKSGGQDYIVIDRVVS